MKKFVFLLSAIFLLAMSVQAQEEMSSKPKVGRYIQNTKETKVSYNPSVTSRSNPLTFRVTSVDVLSDEKMRINLIIDNSGDRKCLIRLNEVKNHPLYIIDEKITKYKPLRELQAEWTFLKKNKKEYYVLAPTEKVKGTVIFPVLVKGARKFELYIGHDALPIKNIQLIE